MYAFVGQTLGWNLGTNPRSKSAETLVLHSGKVSPLFLRWGPTGQVAVLACNRFRKSTRRRTHVSFMVVHSLLIQVVHLYLRILCASILRFWLLEHTTATRSGWLGISSPRLKLTDTSFLKLTVVLIQSQITKQIRKQTPLFSKQLHLPSIKSTLVFVLLWKQEVKMAEPHRVRLCSMMSAVGGAWHTIGSENCDVAWRKLTSVTTSCMNTCFCSISLHSQLYYLMLIYAFIFVLI